MMRQLRSFAAWGAIGALALVVNTAHAQGAMDTPSLSVLKSNRAEVTVRITAGPSGAPGGVYLEWMNWDAYDANGGWATDIYGGLYYCEFTGTPTWHVGSYQLGPGESVDVVLGALFDETGVGTDWTDEMPEGGHFVVRAHAEGFGTTAESPNTGTLEAFTTQNPNNCTFTQGYWKTHYPAAWLVSNLTIGTVNYSAAQLESIFNTPAGGNGLLILAHQLIAAKLNIANGASSAGIASTISTADGLIGGLIIPPVGAGFLSPASTNSLTNTLDDWNNGVTGPGHCGDVPTKETTWGRLKTLYR